MFRAIAIASLMTASAAAAPLAGPPLSTPRPAADGLVEVKARKPIDKSCLMICKRWGEDDCLEWKMVCKGDTDYPKAMLNSLN